MFLLLPCATIKDSITIPSLGQSAKIGQQMNKARQTIKQYSNVQYLLKKIQQGQVIMTRKIQFDNYLKSQVDLMRACVAISFPCVFQYTSYMDSDKVVSTAMLSTRQQWAVQMVMSRYTINSIYHAAAYNSLASIFAQTANSYDKGYKNTTKLITNLQITFKYFNEGYQPLKRLAQVYPTLQQLLLPQNKDITSQILQLRRQIFLSIQFLVACNLSYLKLQKYRLMSEWRSCKQLAYSVHNLIKDTKTVLNKAGLIDKVHSDMKVYLQIGQLFFLAYSFYFLLQEHEDVKNKQQYGFIKKQFQQMIVQNCVTCQQFIKLAQKISSFPGKQTLDNAMFADSIIQVMLKQVKRKQYTYGINIHENKQLKVPTIDQVIASRIASKNLWDAISQF